MSSFNFNAPDSSCVQQNGDFFSGVIDACVLVTAGYNACVHVCWCEVVQNLFVVVQLLHRFYK